MNYGGENYETIPQTLKDLLEKLEFISLTKPGKKQNISSKSFIESTGFLSSIIRTWYSENQDKTVDFLDKVIEDTIEALKHHEKYRDIIKEKLNCAKIGIENLRTTYKDSAWTCSRLGVILTNIEIQLTS